MQLKVGTYAFDANSLKFSTQSRKVWNEGGQLYAIRKSISVDGYLVANGQAAISAAIVALENALAIPYQDIVFYHDDATVSATALVSSSSVSGVQITNGPNFPDSVGVEFVNQRRFNFSAEAEYPAANSNNLLLSFREKLTFSGGGPIYVHKMAINGPSQKQLVYPFSIFKATQEGMATGYRHYPVAPDPIWPSALMTSPNQSLESPRRRGKVQAGYDSYPTAWSYNFESTIQLVGFPSLWV